MTKKIEEIQQKKSNMWITTILIPIALLFISLIVYFFDKTYSQKENEEPVQDNTYEAVFLSNGQVYFGNIVKEETQYLILNDIYYLQIDNELQTQDTIPTNSSDLKLIKFGNELHGPTDEMKINMEHVLFTEILRNDSKVVEAIKNHKGN